MADPAKPLPHLYLVRLSGELSTKARGTRRRFASRLVRNLRDALARGGLEGRVTGRYDRIYVESQEPAGSVLARVFGVQSLSRVEPGPAASLEEVVTRGVELFAAEVGGRRFAVRARHVGERGQTPFRAGDVDVALGTALLPGAARVDLDHPEVTARIELYEGRAFFFRDRVGGPGGFPLGSAGRAVWLSTSYSATSAAPPTSSACCASPRCWPRGGRRVRVRSSTPSISMASPASCASAPSRGCGRCSSSD
jgi:thiamine biosynthesis protein ThiI